MKIASLYNLKGGVGKTASCVNFAYRAAKDGFTTLIWDLDPQGAASYYYNAQAPVKSSAKKIIEQTISLKEAIVHSEYKGLDIIPADRSSRKLDLLIDAQNGSKKHFKNLLKDGASSYDFVFIDCPPGFSHVADNIFYASDVVLMPIIPTTLSVRTYEQMSAYFEDKEIDLGKLLCFFSMVDMRKTVHKDYVQELSADKHFFQHYIPYLSDIEKMGVKTAPVEVFAPNGKGALSYRELWAEVLKRIKG